MVGIDNMRAMKQFGLKYLLFLSNTHKKVETFYFKSFAFEENTCMIFLFQSQLYFY